jgi:predicted metal-dependent HD superfamily phosphohydrolase
MVDPEQTRWLESWRKLGVKSDPTHYFADLKARYSESHRAYHNLAHVLDCLDEFKTARVIAEDASAVEMAIWYHDVVYDPKAKNNEEESAELAAKVCAEVGIAEPRTRKMKDLILATKKHQATEGDAAIVVDVDLSILGRDPIRFRNYENQICEEYSWVSEEAFAAGRVSVLEGFLGRPAIYSTEFFRNKYEQQARENLISSIQNLRSHCPTAFT